MRIRYVTYIPSIAEVLDDILDTPDEAIAASTSRHPNRKKEDKVIPPLTTEHEHEQEIDEHVYAERFLASLHAAVVEYRAAERRYTIRGKKLSAEACGYLLRGDNQTAEALWEEAEAHWDKADRYEAAAEDAARLHDFILHG